MRENRTWPIAAVMAAVFTLGACSAEVTGMPAPASTGAQPTGSASSAPERRLAEPGQCVSGNDPTPVDCGQQHTVEITQSGTLGQDMPEEPPEHGVVFNAVLPVCRQAAAGYLGNDNYDATTLGAWVLWAGPDDWRRGERWYRCGVAELSTEGDAVTRTASVKGALAGDGFYGYQICSSVRPSKAKRAERTACDGPHTAEAFAAVPMGEPRDKFPGEAEFNAKGKERCTQLAREYLGGRGRDDVFVAWLWPGQENWSYGYNNLTCYVETEAPVTRSLHGIANSPLPR